MEYKFQVRSTLCNNQILGDSLCADRLFDVLHILHTEYYDVDHLFMYLTVVEVE